MNQTCPYLRPGSVPCRAILATVSGVSRRRSPASAASQITGSSSTSWMIRRGLLTRFCMVWFPLLSLGDSPLPISLVDCPNTVFVFRSPLSHIFILCGSGLCCQFHVSLLSVLTFVHARCIIIVNRLSLHSLLYLLFLLKTKIQEMKFY